MRINKYRFIKTLFTFILMLLCTRPAHSEIGVDTISYQNYSARESIICDTTDQQSTKFNPQQLILPGTLMVSGLIGAIDYDNNLNRSVNDAMTKLSNGHQCKVDDYLRFVPSAAHLVMGSLGVKSKHNFKERFLISATAHAAMLVMGYGTKYIVHEQRPDLSNKHSFPSGHVALAFTGAELLRTEYGNLYGIAGYALASSVALLRLYNNRHWFNDVLMGAGIGILSARIGYWMLPLERKLFKINRKHNGTSTITATPFYNTHDRACMLVINAVF